MTTIPMTQDQAEQIARAHRHNPEGLTTCPRCERTSTQWETIQAINSAPKAGACPCCHSPREAN
jgi:2-keto-3-deoxy-L-rhamnonate aldolase RhmA